MSKILLTGIKPTGTPHLGNFLGAISPSINFSKKSDCICFYFIADYHSLTTQKNKEKLKQYILEVACSWLACGLDEQVKKNVCFYRQSDITEIFELTTILSNITPKGLLNRAHAYKALIEQNRQEGIDEDSNVNMGLYTYPLLMAADILIMNTDFVPVGIDQKQHVEIARDIADYFNKTYGKTLKLPKESIDEKVALIRGLDGRKMSKSYNNTIPLFCDEKTLQKLIGQIKTDSSGINEPKDTNSVIFEYYSNFASSKQIDEFKKLFEEGISWADAKKKLFELLNSKLSKMKEKYDYYMENPEIVMQILKEGGEKVRPIAKKILTEVKKAIGIS